MEESEMEEVSNRTIAGLLVVAMVISLTGTFFSLSKLDMLQRDTVTGFATAPNATATLSIDDVASIMFLIDTVNWGTGSVDSNVNHFCNLTTLNMSAISHTAACSADFNPPPQPLVLKNDGNVHVSVTLAANATPADWLGDSSGRLFFEVYRNQTTDACAGGTAAGENTVLNTDAVNVCTAFTFNAGQDQLNIPLKVMVPYNVTGAKTVKLTATATAI
jgi:hypothetical protein